MVERIQTVKGEGGDCLLEKWRCFYSSRTMRNILW